MLGRSEKNTEFYTNYNIYEGTMRSEENMNVDHKMYRVIANQIYHNRIRVSVYLYQYCVIIFNESDRDRKREREKASKDIKLKLDPYNILNWSPTQNS